MRARSYSTTALAVLRLPSPASAAAAPPAHTLSRAGRCAAEAAAPAPPQPAAARGAEPEDAAGVRPPARRRAAPPRPTAPGARSRCRACSTPRAVAVAVPRRGAPLPHELHGPGHAARLPLADRLRERAPHRHRVPERAPAGPQRRPLHAVHARGRAGCAPGARNRLVVVVDSRKDPRLPEGWWNWGGIVRPVQLIPAGRAHLDDLGTMSQVRCRGPATRLPRRAAARRGAPAQRRARASRRRSRCGCARRRAA